MKQDSSDGSLDSRARQDYLDSKLANCYVVLRNDEVGG